MSEFFRAVKNENGNTVKFEMGDNEYDVNTIFEAVNLFESSLWRAFVFATDEVQDRTNDYWDAFDKPYDESDAKSVKNHYEAILKATALRSHAEGRQAAFREMLREKVSWNTYDVAISIAETCSCRFF